MLQPVLCYVPSVESINEFYLKNKEIYYIFIIKEYLENIERYKKENKDYLQLHKPEINAESIKCR